MQAKKLQAAALSTQTVYIEDVFSTYLYTGNGSTQTITNGIDLAGEGGLVWIKSRTAANRDHMLFDTTRGSTNVLYSNATLGQATVSTSLTAFSASGFSVGTNSDVNENLQSIASWTFRKAPKFFDVVTFTSNSSGGATISHSLAGSVGMVTVKATGTTSNWNTYHRSLNLASGAQLTLNGTGAAVNQGVAITFSNTQVTFGSGLLANSTAYVAYLFAHDTDPDGLIQCGSFTIAGGTDLPVNLGWEPQFVIVKKSNDVGSWLMQNDKSGMPVGQNDVPSVYANLSNSEANNPGVFPTSTGFTTGGLPNDGYSYIYLAIRRGPMKPPTSGTEVYNAIARMGTSGAKVTSGILTDAVIIRRRNTTSDFYVYDRLRGSGKDLKTNLTAPEASTYAMRFDQQDGYVPASAIPINYTGTYSYVDNAFRRAPGFFDVVCYTGTGVARTVSHNLGVVPELMIVRNRNIGDSWYVYHKQIGTFPFILLNSSDPQNQFASSCWNSDPTASVFGLSSAGGINANTRTYVAYLFASLPGISKVFSYTGNGSSQTIDCGFTGGARFVLIKRTDSPGDWYVWDSARGIVAGNDPHLSLNTTAAEVTTDDSVDTDSTGFVVNQLAATDVNANAATYIGLAIA